MLDSLVALLLMVQPLPPPFPRDGATKVFENELVVIWDVSWKRGEATPLHEYRFPAVSVTIEAGRAQTTLADGMTVLDATAELGSVHFTERATVRREKGVSDTPQRAFVVELKQPPPPPDPIPEGAVPAWPRDGAKKLLENDRIVVWDYTFAPDVTVPLHYHDKEQIIVSLASGKFRMIPPEGDPRVSEGRLGRAVFVRRGALHREEYHSGTPRAIAIQLKR